jgi:radical SAM protein with 4Fe4S-binding SPASM domain
MANGKSSFDAAQAGLKACQDLGLAVGARSTLAAQVADSWVDVINELIRYGFWTVETQFVERSGRFASEKIKVSVANRLKYLDQYIERTRQYVRRYGEFPSGQVDLFAAPRALLTAPQHRMRACGAGMTTIAIGRDGSIFPCLSFTEVDEMAIGNVLSPGHEPAISSWMPSVEELPKCQSCFLKYSCLGGCYASAFKHAKTRSSAEATGHQPAVGSCSNCPSGSSCSSSPTTVGETFVPDDDTCTILRRSYEKNIALLHSLAQEGVLSDQSWPRLGAAADASGSQFDRGNR